MNHISANEDLERFRSGAEKYAAYLETPEGHCALTSLLRTYRSFSRKRSDLCAL